LRAIRAKRHSSFLPRLVSILTLRYRLLWARARLKTGKCVLFFLAYMFGCLMIILLTAGRFSALIAMFRTAEAELLTCAVLSGVSVTAIAAAVMLGVGNNAVLSDAALRSYPLSVMERLIARHLSAILGPWWTTVFAVYFGIGLGFYRIGTATLWLIALAAILLTFANSIAASILYDLLARATATRAGLVATLIVLLTSLVVSSTAHSLRVTLVWSHRLFEVASPLLIYTPSFAAAELMAGDPGPHAILRVLILLAWCAGSFALLAALERAPLRSRTVVGVHATWDGPCDRIATAFGRSAPVIAKVLRYHFRSNRARFGYAVSLPALIFPLATARQFRAEPEGAFYLALGIMAIVGFVSTSSTALNVFGYDGSGFRRYFLLPVEPATILRGVSLVPLLLGFPVVAAALPVCLHFMRMKVDSRIVAMLLANGVGGLFFFHAIGLWTSLLAPSRSDFRVPFFASDLSFAAMSVMVVSLATTLAGSYVVGRVLGVAIVLSHWWIALGVMLTSVAFYLLTLRFGAAVFVRRRERILVVIEQHT